MFDTMSSAADTKGMLFMTVGCIIGLGTVTFLSHEYDAPILIASLGATAVLVYGAPESPFARPRNVFFGHLISAVIGVLFFTALGCEWYSMTAAVTVSIAAMSVTKTMHPPGGATALVCVESMASPAFIVMPVMLGAVALMSVAFIIQYIEKFVKAQRDPKDTESA